MEGGTGTGGRTGGRGKIEGKRIGVRNWLMGELGGMENVTEMLLREMKMGVVVRGVVGGGMGEEGRLKRRLGVMKGGGGQRKVEGRHGVGDRGGIRGRERRGKVDGVETCVRFRMRDVDELKHGAIGNGDGDEMGGRADEDKQ